MPFSVSFCTAGQTEAMSEPSRFLLSVCSTHERAYRSYHIVFAPSEATLRDYIQSELRDYEARRKAAKMLQVQEPNYSLEVG